MRRSEDGQAIVEMALVTPILLLLIVGVFQVGLALLTSLQLTHAAQQGVTAGANDPAVPQQCATAISTAEAVYSGALDDAQCTPGDTLSLTLTDTVPMVSPFGPWTLDVTARAVSPEPSP
jgi:Flp pilus assembly protein TadG